MKELESMLQKGMALIREGQAIVNACHTLKRHKGEIVNACHTLKPHNGDFTLRDFMTLRQLSKTAARRILTEEVRNGQVEVVRIGQGRQPTIYRRK